MPNLVKAWMANLTGGLPLAYFKEDGTLIWYWNGLQN